MYFTGSRELLQSFGQHARAQMLGKQRQLVLTVRESTFDNQVPEVIDLVDRLPERFAHPGIAGEDQAGRAGIDPVAERRNRMIDGKR